MEAPSVLTAPSRTRRLAEGRLALATRAATFLRFGGRWLCLLVTRCSPLPHGPSWGGRQGSRGLPGWSAVDWVVGCVLQTDQESIRARGNPEFLSLQLLSRSCRAGGGLLGT